MIKSKPLDPCVHCGKQSESTICVIGYKTKQDNDFVLTGKGMVCGPCFEEHCR